MTPRIWAVLPVTDLAPGIGFFTGPLGWRLGDQPGDDLAYLHDSAGHTLLLAGPRAADLASYVRPQTLIKAPGDPLRLPCPDVEAQRRALEQRGLQLEERETAWRDRELHVSGPGGLVVVFIQPATLALDELLALFLAGPEALRSALTGLDEAALDLARAPGSWSIRQIVHHIADGDDLWALAAKAALASPGTLYAHDWYSSDNRCAETLDYAGRSTEPALALLQASREHTAQLVRHLPHALERCITFSSPGAAQPRLLSVGAILRMQARHALEHVEEIRQIRQQHGR